MTNTKQKDVFITLQSFSNDVVSVQEIYKMPNDLRHFDYKDNLKMSLADRRKIITELGGELHDMGDQAARMQWDAKDFVHIMHYYQNGKRSIGPNGYACEHIYNKNSIRKGYLLLDNQELANTPHTGSEIICHLLKQNSGALIKTPLSTYAANTLKNSGFTVK